MEDSELDLFTVDETTLDREWFRQARLIYDYSMKLKDAREVRDRARAVEDVAKDDLKIAMARINLHVRKNPELYGVEKTTEGVVDAAVLSSPDYRTALTKVHNARQKVIDAEVKVGELESFVKALEHKRPALECGVKLMGLGYFGEPSMKAAGSALKGVMEKGIDRAFKPKKKEARGD